MKIEDLQRLNVQPLNVPVPPMLEAALGYLGSAPFLAIYWDAEIEEARCDDGTFDIDARRSAWDVYLGHPKFAQPHDRYTFGGEDCPAAHFLLLDRTQRILYVGPITSLSATLRVLNPQQGNEAAQDPETQMLAWLDNAI